MIDIYKFNPMDWHNTRYISSIPAHFVFVKLQEYNPLALLSWVEQNTSGRYTIGFVQIKRNTKESNTIIEEKVIAFEDPQDLTIFTLFYK